MESSSTFSGTSPRPQGYDDIVNHLGLGRWQVPHLLAVCIAVFHSGPLLVMTNFQNAPARFRCTSGPPSLLPEDGVLPGGNSSTFAGNFSQTHFDNTCFAGVPDLHPFPELHNSSDILKTGLRSRPGAVEGIVERGAMVGDGVQEQHQKINSGPEVPCRLLEYDTSEFTSTFTTEFDLICDRAHLRPLFQILFAAGYASGDLFGGFLTDRFGRRFAFRVGSSLSLTANVLLFLAPNAATALLVRYLMGAACTTTSIPSAAAATENVPGEYRANSVSVAMGLPNCVSIMTYSLIAYYIRDWRLLQLTLIIPALGYIPVLYFFDESPRWLALHGRHAEALALLRRAARLNGATLPPEVHVTKALEAMAENSEVKKVDAESSKTHVAGLSCMKTLKVFLGSPVMCRVTLLTPTVWFLHCLFYIGIPLSAHNNGGSPFVYLALTGLADFASPVLGVLLGNRWGRVRFLFSLSVLSGGSSLLCLVSRGHVELQWFFMIFAMSLIATAYLIHYTYVAELNPTCVRGKGIALCAFVGHSSYTLAPYITDVLATIHDMIPSMVFGMCGLVAACILPLLPETKDLPLCETVQDVEKRSKKMRKKPRVSEEKPLARSANAEG